MNETLFTPMLAKNVWHSFTRDFSQHLCACCFSVWATEKTLEVHWHKMNIDVQRSDGNVWIKRPDRGEENLPHYNMCSAATLKCLHTHSGSLPLSESQFYLHSSLGLSSPPKNNATPCGVSKLFQRLNQFMEEVRRQGTTRGRLLRTQSQLNMTLCEHRGLFIRARRKSWG